MKYYLLVPPKMLPKKSILSNSQHYAKLFTIEATCPQIEFLATLLPTSFAF